MHFPFKLVVDIGSLDMERSCCQTKGNSFLAPAQGCSGGLMDFAFKFVVDIGGLDTERDYAYWGIGGTCDELKEKRCPFSWDSTSFDADARAHLGMVMRIEVVLSQSTCGCSGNGGQRVALSKSVCSDVQLCFHPFADGVHLRL